MERDQFWQLIKESREDVEGCEEQAEKLTALLADLEPEEIIEFDIQFDNRLAETLRRDLWAVAYIVNGGCSDDGFVYFCCWLIGQGQEYFEAALKDPERAADNAEPESYDNECEDLMYCAMKAYEAKTGHAEMPLESSSEPTQYVPKGKNWTEEDLPKLFPQLCKKFGYE